MSQQILNKARELFVQRADAIESKDYNLANELNTQARNLLRDNGLSIQDYVEWNKGNPKGNPLRTTAATAADDAIAALKTKQGAK